MGKAMFLPSRRPKYTKRYCWGNSHVAMDFGGLVLCSRYMSTL